jgi:hypothetical protein
MRGVVGIVSKIFLQKIDGVRMKIKKYGLLFFWMKHQIVVFPGYEATIVLSRTRHGDLSSQKNVDDNEVSETGLGTRTTFFRSSNQNCVDLPNHSTVHGCKHMEPTNTNTFNTFNPTTRQHTPTKILQSSHGRARVFHSSKLRWTVFILSRMIHGWMARCLCQHP